MKGFMRNSAMVGNRRGFRFLTGAAIVACVASAVGFAATGSGTTTPPVGWESKPVIVNIQIDLENEQDVQRVGSILNVIEQHSGFASIFVTGELASIYADAIRDIEKRGHQIAVHGWHSGEDISSLSANEQLRVIENAFTAVRSAVGKPEGVVDFKPQGYKFNTTTVKTVERYGARSISGLFPFDERICSCWYAKEVGRITFPYPVTTEFWAVPISEVQVNSVNVPLDDSYAGNASDFLNHLMQAHSQATQTKDPLVIVVHPSISGTDQAMLGALASFLDHVMRNSGKIATLDSICHFTTYISNFSVTGPSSADVAERVTIRVTYTSNIWCPNYRFRAYGKYQGEEWKLLDSHCEFVYTGNHYFDLHTSIPTPPCCDDNIYTVRIVGRASFGGCAPSDFWPIFDSYEVMDEFTIEVERECVTIIKNGDPSTKLDIVFVGDDYSESQLETFASDVSTHMNKLLSYEPFKSDVSKINVHRVDKVEDLECHYNCGGIDRLICCNTSKVSELASTCPVDQIIVLVNNGKYGGGGYTCAGIGVAYRDDGRVTTHEFGHSFGCLHDHYPSDPSCEKYKCMMCSLEYPFATSPCNCQQSLANKLSAYQTVPETSSDQIYVMGLHYDMGDISLIGVSTKVGHAPDRKIYNAPHK